MANADSFLSSPVQPREKQDVIRTTITDGLRLANQSSQQGQEKQQHSQSDQQKPLTHNKFDNHAPSVLVW